MNPEEELYKILSEALSESIDKEIMRNISQTYLRQNRIKTILKNIKSFGLSAEPHQVPKP